MREIFYFQHLPWHASVDRRVDTDVAIAQIPPKRQLVKSNISLIDAKQKERLSPVAPHAHARGMITSAGTGGRWDQQRYNKWLPDADKKPSLPRGRPSAPNRSWQLAKHTPQKFSRLRVGFQHPTLANRARLECNVEEIAWVASLAGNSISRVCVRRSDSRR